MKYNLLTNTNLFRLNIGSNREHELSVSYERFWV